MNGQDLRPKVIAASTSDVRGMDTSEILQAALKRGTKRMEYVQKREESGGKEEIGGKESLEAEVEEEWEEGKGSKRKPEQFGWLRPPGSRHVSKNIDKSINNDQETTGN